MQQLEARLKELQIRVEALERLIAPRAEHPSDEVSVRGKVVYDWQS
ncbi:MAG: hypothetical protein ACRECR_02620 [Thermoplasmata archaeon]